MSVTFFAPQDGETRIFGRERERSGLGALLDRARHGLGSIVLVGGHAGIGKTTLVRDLERRAVDRGMLTLTGYCYDLTVTPPYGPWAQIAHASTRIGGLPVLPAAFQDEEALKQSESRQALFQEMEHFLISMAEQHPLVLILEDLHWSDHESLEFLRWFGHQVGHHPILIAVTYRDDELTRQHSLYELLPALVRETPAQRINLRPLDEPAVRSLVTSRYRMSEVSEKRLAKYLWERAEGNPFFVGELLRALDEEERIYQADDGSWTLADLEHLPVPPLVRQVIDGRLNRLGEDAREALEVAAIIGQDVPLTIWSTVSDMPDGALVSVIQRAADAHLIQDARDGAALRFSHALVREALYEGMLLPRRRALHHRVAEELISGSGVAPDIVAYHLKEAGDPRAIDWYIQAGTRAERVAWLTAAEHLKAALQLMREHDVDLAERGWLIIRLVRLLRFADQALSLVYLEEALEYARQAGDPNLMAYATFCRGEVRYYQGEGAAGILDCDAALAILRDLSTDDRQRLDELIGAGVLVSDVVLTATFAAALGHVGATRRAMDTAKVAISEGGARGASVPAEAPWAVGLAQALTGELNPARQAFARAREQFRASHDYVMVGSVAFMELVIAVLAFQTDNLTERERIISEGRRAWTRARGAHGGFEPEVIRLPALVLEGAWHEARDQIVAVQSIQMTMSRKHIFLSLLAQIAYGQGDATVARRLINSILSDGPATAPGNTHIVAGLNFLSTAGLLALDDRDLDAARAWLEASDRWLDWSGSLLGRADSKLLWARYHRAAGNQAAALETASEALALAAEPRQPLALLRAYRLLGDLETAAGSWGLAERKLQESLQLAESCRSPYERALTIMALAELARSTGEATRARQLIAQVRTICEPLGAKPTLERVQRLEAQLPMNDAASDTYPAGLTSREIEVLRLVATGLTNAAVAEQLFVSRRTVDQHLRSIYNKLGVSSRSAATRIAVTEGLV